MSRAPPFFVIRNSIHDVVGGSAHNAISLDVLPGYTVDEHSKHEKQTGVSVVRVVEAPTRGMYKLDFCHEDCVSKVDEFLGDCDESKEIYLDERSWRHLYTFVTLVGKEGALSCCPIEEQRYHLLSQQADRALCLTLLKEFVVDVLGEVLPLDKLFTWNVLVDARNRRDLNWKDIRAFISMVRENVLFLTKDGILKPHQNLHLTFLQFVAFSKLVENHMNVLARKLPRVCCRVLGTSTTTLDLEVETTHDCVVQIGAVMGDTSPTSVDLRDGGNMFISLKSVKLGTGTRAKIKVDSLTQNTSYRIFLRVEKYSSGGNRLLVASSDTEVLKSQMDAVTDCRYPSDIFPEFTAMSLEEQKIEILACVNDKTVRQEAPIIPLNKDMLISTNQCSAEWAKFIRWWLDNDGIRAEFLMRELMFAALDKEVCRQAELCGISMTERKSKDPKRREKWNTQFAAWYYGQQIPSMAQHGDEKKGKGPSHFNPRIQNFHFDNGKDRVAEQASSSNLLGFTNRVRQACVIGSDSAQKSIRDDAIRSELGLRDSKTTDEERLLDMNVISLRREGGSEMNSLSASFISCRDRFTAGVKVADTSEQSTDIVRETYDSTVYTNKEIKLKALDDDCSSKASPTKESKIEPNIIGAKMTSHRRHFLDRVTKNVEAARFKADQLTHGSPNLRGIDLFRAKVRLVMILKKIAHPSAFSTEFLDERAPMTASVHVFDLFEFDETMYDFDSLAKNHKNMRNDVNHLRFNPNDVNGMRHRNDLKLIKKAFETLFNWKNKQLIDRDEMRRKMLIADTLYGKSLVKRCFHIFHQIVVEMKETQVNVEVAPQKTKSSPLLSNLEGAHGQEINARMSNLGIKQTPCFEMTKLSFEDTLSSKFRENCRRFQIDPSPIHEELYSLHNQLSCISKPDYEQFLAHGIELEPTKSCDNSFVNSLMIFDQDTLRQLKYQKLNAHRSSGVNIFDVPTHHLFKSFPHENDRSYIEYRLREIVQCLTELNG